MSAILAFLPETVLCATGLALLLRTLGASAVHIPRLDRFMAAAAAAYIGSIFLTIDLTTTLFSGTYRVDLFSQTVKLALGAAFLLTQFVGNLSIGIPEKRRLEHHLFSVAAMLGMTLMASSVNWLTLVVAIELSSYSLYLLVALRGKPQFAEANVKYLILGAAASGVLLWGISLLCGLTGSVSLLEPSVTRLLWDQPAFRLGLLMVAVALLFKLAAFPMHFWAPDAYEASSTPATQFLATASKVAAVAVLIRFFSAYSAPAPLVTVLGILAFISMTLGNTAALIQKDFKRLMAYSSVSQAGYIILGLMAGSFNGYSTALFYAAAYALMNTAVFLAAAHVARASGEDNPSLKHFEGLAEKSPFLALLLLLGLLSLAGIPPLAGFTAKWFLFSAAMDQGHWFLVLWAVLNSVVSLFYYLTLVKHAYLAKPVNPAPIRLDWGSKMLGVFLFVSLVGLGVYPDPILGLARLAVSGCLPTP